MTPPLYEVTLLRTRSEQTTLDVVAPNEEIASAKALERVANASDSIEWDLIDEEVDVDNVDNYAGEE